MAEKLLLVLEDAVRVIRPSGVWTPEVRVCVKIK